jgi:hypothetical protein
VVLSISVVLTALVIVALNAYVTNKQLAQNGNSSFIDKAFSTFSYDDGYRDGYSAAREKFGVLPSEITAITGNVMDMDQSFVTIKAINIDTDEFVDRVSDIRKGLITASTTIMLRKVLTGEELDAAMIAWRKNPADNPPPVPYTETKASLNDLSAGATVLITALEDIRLKESFYAQNIIIIYQPETTVPSE